MSTMIAGLTPDELQQMIAQTVKHQLCEHSKETQPVQQKEYLSTKEVCELLGVHISTVNNWKNSKKLKPKYFGGRVYYLRTDIDNTFDSINS